MLSNASELNWAKMCVQLYSLLRHSLCPEAKQILSKASTITELRENEWVTIPVTEAQFVLRSKANAVKRKWTELSENVCATVCAQKQSKFCQRQVQLLNWEKMNGNYTGYRGTVCAQKQNKFYQTQVQLVNWTERKCIGNYAGYRGTVYTQNQSKFCRTRLQLLN